MCKKPFQNVDLQFLPSFGKMVGSKPQMDRGHYETAVFHAGES